jgi:hypothetical protein
MTTPLETKTVSDKIAARIDTQRTDLIGFDKTGSLSFGSASDLMEFAKMMAISGTAIPKHLRDNPGGCLAITIQAKEWAMSPFAVANKSYSVNDRIAYESQLVSAVILRRAPLAGRFTIEYKGIGGTRTCTVSATTIDGQTVSYTTPEFDKITVKNSPLWKSDPDQQLSYFAQRSLCRRHFPDVLLGVYTQDELIESQPMRNATPRQAPAFVLPTADETPAIETAEAEVVSPLG